jgi:hypothetical protein
LNEFRNSSGTEVLTIANFCFSLNFQTKHYFLSYCSILPHKTLYNFFGITQLLSRIDNYRDGDFDAMRMALQKQEVESIANLLIEQLIANLKGSVLANYLYLVRNRSIHRQEGDRSNFARCKN